MVATILAGYALSKKHLRGGGIIMRLFVFTMFFNGGLIPNFLWVKSLGLINTVWAILLPLAINPFFMIIMRTFFLSIPESLEQAAEIDGLNPVQILARIVLPLSKPILATIGLFYGVFYWNDWFRPLIFLNDSRMQPVTLYLRNLVMGQQLAAQQGEVTGAGAELVSETLKSASILLVSVPILCVYPFLQKYFVKGILIGSVKG
jgi:putative aldouronate transport system permease protein